MRNDTRGFTLIEALIALLVLTVGLLGAASMLLTSVRNSHNSYLRSQASFMADSSACSVLPYRKRFLHRRKRLATSIVSIQLPGLAS